MIFGKEYKNNEIKRDKSTEKLIKELGYDFSNENPADVVFDSDKISAALDRIKTTEQYINDWILNNINHKIDPYYDSAIINHLNNLHNFVSKYIPNYPKYYDPETETVNPKSFFDSLELIKKELGTTPESMIYSGEENYSGSINDTKLHIENGMSIDSVGNIYDADNEMIFNPTTPEQPVKYIDFINEKVTTNTGIRIDLPEDFIENSFKKNDGVPDDVKNRLDEIKDEIKTNKPNEDGTINYSRFDEYIKWYDSAGVKPGSQNKEDIVAVINGIPITRKDEKLIKLDVDDVFIGDIFTKDKKIDINKQIRNYKEAGNSFGVCNFNSIPYFELTMLLLIGGGKRGERPLSSKDIGNSDISFKSDGSVYYSGENSTVSIARSGCTKSTYKTGHVLMWSKDNPVGLKISFLQIIYKLCAAIGLFNCNIPKLIGFKKFKVFPGMCIGGLLEKVFCTMQEKISKRINELFVCEPTRMPSDLSFSGFENRLYAHGASVEKLEMLDKLSGIKCGDRYVVDVVDTSVTGLKKPACGTFVFDPHNLMKGKFPWKYKYWSGKPFVEGDVSENQYIPMNISNETYTNPIVKDMILNTDMLGTGNITRKLMALQFEFAKKNSLITIGDIEKSLDASFHNIIYEILKQLPTEIARYIEILHFEEGKLSVYGNFETINFINKFKEYFSSLVSSGILKEPDYKSCQRVYNHVSGGSVNDPTSPPVYTQINYYDFSGYDYKKYLIPERQHIPFYDAMLFSEKAVSIEQIETIFSENIKTMEKLGATTHEFSEVHTIENYIDISDDRDVYHEDINSGLKWIKSDLEWDGYEPEAYAQIELRCWHAIKEYIVLKGGN